MSSHRIGHTAGLVLCAAALTSMVCAALAGSNSLQGKEKVGVDAKIGDLSWLRGHWQGSVDGDLLEEVWSGPAGDCMMGMFRWIKGGKVWMYELLAVVEEDGGLVFRFKHFDRRMVGWEEKEKALTFRLIRLNDAEAVFQSTGGDGPWKYIYRKSGDAGALGLTVVLESEKDGKPSTKQMHFKRATPEPD